MSLITGPWMAHIYNERYCRYRAGRCTLCRNRKLRSNASAFNSLRNNQSVQTVLAVLWLKYFHFISFPAQFPFLGVRCPIKRTEIDKSQNLWLLGHKGSSKILLQPFRVMRCSFKTSVTCRLTLTPGWLTCCLEPSLVNMQSYHFNCMNRLWPLCGEMSLTNHLHQS